MDSSGNDSTNDDVERQTRILELRDAGVAWKDIETQFGLTRQQARYAYQLGKRARRRRERQQRN